MEVKFVQNNSVSYLVFKTFNYIILSLLVILAVVPFIHIVAISFSEPGPANANQVGLIPIGFNIDSYKAALSDSNIIKPFYNSIKRVILGVGLNMIFTILVAYPLSKDSIVFPGKQIYTWFLIITMLFNGGLIPSYILINRLKLMDTVWALVLPGIVPIFHVIVLLNFYRQLPKELEESAFIDGASHFIALWRIYLPLSIPSLATLTLFCTIGHWNAWFDGLIYMREPMNYPFTTYLQVLVTRIQNITSLEDAQKMMRISQRSMVMCYFVISIVPIMCVYPFLQKHIKTGLVLGSVKG